MKQFLGPQALLTPTPVMVVGTYDAEGKPNLMTAAWGGLVSSIPPCMGVSLRKATKSYMSIINREAFTVSIATHDMMVATDYCGMVSGNTSDKFEALELTHVKANGVDAPYADEFPVVMECKLVGRVDLGSHTQFIGQIIDVRADDSVIFQAGESKMLDIMKVNPLVFDSAGYQYHTINPAVARAFRVGIKAMLPKT